MKSAPIEYLYSFIQFEGIINASVPLVEILSKICNYLNDCFDIHQCSRFRVLKRTWYSMLLQVVGHIDSFIVESYTGYLLQLVCILK